MLRSRFEVVAGVVPLLFSETEIREESDFLVSSSSTWVVCFFKMSEGIGNLVYVHVSIHLARHRRGEDVLECKRQ